MADNPTHDLDISGAEPAGLTAGLHAARARFHALPPENMGFGGRLLYRKVHILHKRALLRAIPEIQEKTFQNEKISFILCNVVIADKEMATAVPDVFVAGASAPRHYARS